MAATLIPEEVGLLATVSCTGYANPGLDVHVAKDLGMRPEVRRLAVGHMGCYAAIPGLAVATDYVIAQRRPAVLVCTELPSLHVQPPPHDTQQAVAHALFADACAALVLAPSQIVGEGTRRHRRGNAYRRRLNGGHDMGHHRPRVSHGPLPAGPSACGP